MELDKLKSTWDQSSTGKKSQNELLIMTKVKNHPTIKKMKLKFLIEAILLVVFIALYYDGFDGETKPLWANVLLIGATSLYIFVRFVGWLVLRNPINGDNLKQSLLNFQSKLKQITIGIVLTSFLFGCAVISFFSSSIDFTKEKYTAFAFMLFSLILLVYLSSRNWNKRISKIKTNLKEFESPVGQ
ncbi:hypothetical protein [Cyclobacterium amurskyense]|uniref:Uncharacterized protein n=1 Tax=Cyclobacterium amurskyense TaxID=320787 RepID=A0A0H4P645_9BACT|nr:hypothetical protein [Cyclobacterium amurskyense]AKP49574.1 hypothetical protein CA2015_0090 [Cyclobacterium amurskyense]